MSVGKVIVVVILALAAWLERRANCSYDELLREEAGHWSG